MNLIERQIEDWDFRGADTKYSSHGIHYYPARMIPLLLVILYVETIPIFDLGIISFGLH